MSKGKAYGRGGLWRDAWQICDWHLLRGLTGFWRLGRASQSAGDAAGKVGQRKGLGDDNRAMGQLAHLIGTAGKIEMRNEAVFQYARHGGNTAAALQIAVNDHQVGTAAGGSGDRFCLGAGDGANRMAHARQEIIEIHADERIILGNDNMQRRYGWVDRQWGEGPGLVHAGSVKGGGGQDRWGRVALIERYAVNRRFWAASEYTQSLWAAWRLMMVGLGDSDARCGR